MTDAAPARSWPTDLGLLLLRLHVGLAMCTNAGWPKVYGAPEEGQPEQFLFPSASWFLEQVQGLSLPFVDSFAHVYAFAGAWTEVLGGLFLALGIYSRFWATLLAIQFGYASFDFQGVIPIFDLHIAQVFFWAYVCLAFAGGGRFALGRVIPRLRG